MSYKILDTNRITHTHKFFINSLEDLNSLPKEPASTALIANENKTYICTNAGNWVLFNLDSSATAEQPEGTIEITENGTYDIAQYAAAEVDVPNPSAGDLSVISNGVYDTTSYASVTVNVPNSSYGTKNITENGTHNVKGYANVKVNVQPPSSQVYFTISPSDSNDSNKSFVISYTNENVEDKYLKINKSTSSTTFSQTALIGTYVLVYTNVSDLALPTLTNISSTLLKMTLPPNKDFYLFRVVD